MTDMQKLKFDNRGNVVPNKCKHTKLTRQVKPNQESDLIKNIEVIRLWNLKTGDYNDVYENKEVRGTYSQLEELANSYFTKSQLKNRCDFDSCYDDIITIAIINRHGDTDFFVNVYKDEFPRSQYKSFVDLVKEQD
jgi:hypothetical protein